MFLFCETKQVFSDLICCWFEFGNSLVTFHFHFVVKWNWVFSYLICCWFEFGKSIGNISFCALTNTLLLLFPVVVFWVDWDIAGGGELKLSFFIHAAVFIISTVCFDLPFSLIIGFLFVAANRGIPRVQGKAEIRLLRKMLSQVQTLRLHMVLFWNANNSSLILLMKW